MGYKDVAKQKEYQKNWNKINRHHIREKRYDRLRAWLNTIKDQPCKDCKRRYPPYVMQFDHVRGTKIMDVSHILSRKGIAATLKEITKCELVCANCHAVRTQRQYNKKRAKKLRTLKLRSLMGKQVTYNGPSLDRNQPELPKKKKKRI